MFRNAVFASLIALGAASVAQAQDFGPRLIGNGDDARVVYAEPSRNLVGGGFASITGTGDDARLAYSSTVTSQAQGGLVAELTGTGDNAQLVYQQAAPVSTMAAGRTAQPRG